MYSDMVRSNGSGCAYFQPLHVQLMPVPCPYLDVIEVQLAENNGALISRKVHHPAFCWDGEVVILKRTTQTIIPGGYGFKIHTTLAPKIGWLSNYKKRAVFDRA